MSRAFTPRIDCRLQWGNDGKLLVNNLQYYYTTQKVKCQCLVRRARSSLLLPMFSALMMRPQSPGRHR